MTQLVGGREFLCDCCELVTETDELTHLQLTQPGSRWVNVDLCASCWLDCHAQLHYALEWQFVAYRCAPVIPRPDISVSGG